MNKLCTLGITFAAAAALTAGGTTPALASTPHAGGSGAAKSCPEETYYTVKSKKAVNYWVPGTNFVDGKGGEVTGKVDKSWTKSATLEAGAEASIGALWLTVKGHVSKSATKSNTVTVGHWYSHKIPKGKYGHLRYRVVGYKVLFWKMQETRKCKEKLLDAFYGNIPTEKEGWEYWSSKQP
ncbi:hypothetical protein J4573_45585 [Actinomadura barringtoniae]|uniref:Uncharacterized protein n=1 Tax=Actinomadura barringtoniae TaxID=1427535 RepID=A0A939PQL4_9ACTN|nr:hypothetical protein [Actinomadura barringtoniae]MBO2454428.1 hypothetical protein [Actinomadura barringtoniae]